MYNTIRYYVSKIRGVFHAICAGRNNNVFLKLFYSKLPDASKSRAINYFIHASAQLC